jgi:hypothetical protein
MTAITERVDLDAISAQAREVRFGRSVLTLVAAVLFGLGWVTAKAFGLAWLALAWCAVAVKVGWQEGRAKRPVRPSSPA